MEETSQDPEKCVKNNDSNIDFNKILNEIGQFGRWQQRIFMCCCIISLANGLITVAFAFTAYSPKYRCSVPFCEDKSNWTYYESSNSTSYSDFVTAGIPKGILSTPHDCRYLGMIDLTSEPVSSPESCNYYFAELERNSSDLMLTHCPSHELVFDDSVMTSSLVTEFQLTCDRSLVKNALGTSFMIGVLFGSFGIGVFADLFGRKSAFVTGSIGTAICGVAGAFVWTPEAFAFFRFLTGFFAQGLFMMAFIISVECVGPKFAALVGVAINIPFAIGELLLAFEAYLIKEWKMLQIVAHAPVLALVLLVIVLPESTRWLISVGRAKDAQKILVNASKINKKTISKELLPHNDEEESKTKEKPKLKIALLTLNLREKFKNFKNMNLMKMTSNGSFLDLFKPRIMMWRTLNMFFQWFSVTFVYYGLSFTSTSMAGDPFTNFCLTILVEIPGYLFAVFVMDCWGRRPILAFCQVLPGLACVLSGLLVTYPELAPVQLFMSLVGKFGASAGFSIVYLYAAELYPTRIRSTSVGSCSLMARFGAILSMLVELGGSFWKPFPMVLMGIVSVVAGLLAFRLPETAGLPLPETMEDAIEIRNRTNRGLCSCVCPKRLKRLIPETT